MTTKVSIMVPIEDNIKSLFQQHNNAVANGEEKDVVDSLMKQYQHACMIRNLGLNFMEIPVGTG